MRGLGTVFKRGSVWWIVYYHRGHRHRESSHSESESQARRLLKQRLGEITAGRFIGPTEDRLTFDALVADLENDYKVNNRRSLETVRFHVARLQRFFGFDRAVDITPDRVKAYQVQRLNEGASRVPPSTVKLPVWVVWFHWRLTQANCRASQSFNCWMASGCDKASSNMASF